MSYAGFYINLDAKTERRARMEAELARHGLNYARFRAAEGNALNMPNPQNLRPGAMGCFTSHNRLLKENLNSDRHLHVIEDDVVFAACAPQAIKWAIDTGKLDGCDLLYTDVSVPLRSDVYKLYRAMYDKAVTRNPDGGIARIDFNAFSLKDTVWASTSSFLINRASIRKLHDLYETELKHGAREPIDLFIRRMCNMGALRVGCLFPFVTSIDIDDGLSSSAGEMTPPTALARILGRYAFFAGCDWDKAEAYAKKFLPPGGDRQSKILAELLAFSLTDAYDLY